MQMGVDDAGDVARDVLGVRRRAHVLDLGPRVDQSGVDEHEPGRVVDRPDEHGPALALDEELCPEVGADHEPTLPPRAGSGTLRWRVGTGKAMSSDPDPGLLVALDSRERGGPRR